MKKTKSKKLVFDCITVYHNTKVSDELKQNGIDVHPSGGSSFGVKGGYPPNSHDCMPNELINDRLKENARKEFDKLRKSHRTMKSLQVIVNQAAKNLDIEFVRARIAAMPKILRTIETNEGGRTKY